MLRHVAHMWSRLCHGRFSPEVFNPSARYPLISAVFFPAVAAAAAAAATDEAPVLLFNWTIVFRQLLFQCGIQFWCFRQAEILQGQDLPHGSRAPRAAALCDAVSPHPLQARGGRGTTYDSDPVAHRQRDHQPPEWDPAATSPDHNHRREEGGDAGADRDAQPAQRGGGGSERGALLRLGESLSEGLALVSEPDALRLPRAADGGEDAGLLHLQQGPQTHPSDEPWHQAAAHPQRPHWAGAVGLHAGLLQPPPEAQALPAHRVGSGEGRRDQPGIQGAQPQPVLCSHAELAEILPAGEHPRGGRGRVDQGPVPGDEKGGEVPEAGTADKRFELLLQQNEGILLFERPRARALFTWLKGQGSPSRGARHPAETLPLLSRTQPEVLWAGGSNVQLEVKDGVESLRGRRRPPCVPQFLTV